MFPGCTELQMRTHNADVLREAGYRALQGDPGGIGVAAWGARAERFLLQHLMVLLAAIGL
jgi:hypothetical protein